MPGLAARGGSPRKDRTAGRLKRATCRGQVRNTDTRQQNQIREGPATHMNYGKESARQSTEEGVRGKVEEEIDIYVYVGWLGRG
jgi:hypothetical protein